MRIGEWVATMNWAPLGGEVVHLLEQGKVARNGQRRLGLVEDVEAVGPEAVGH